ncbi:MAG: ATP-binding cassette subfamily F protein 3, partial [Congregibacter sp.]
SIYEQDAKAKLTELLRDQGAHRTALEELESEWLMQQESLEAMIEQG